MTKLGKSKDSIPPVMCKGHYSPVSKKWKASATTVNSNGENTILVTSTLKCEHGGKIEIMENGQGNGEVATLGRWLDQAIKGGYSNYNTSGGNVLRVLVSFIPYVGPAAAVRDLKHGYDNKDYTEMLFAGLSLVPGVFLRKKIKGIFSKNGAKVGEEVVETVSGVNLGEETITYRRVQGGEGSQASRNRIVVDSDGNVYINNKGKDLNISIDNGEHSQYFLQNNRPGADIVEFEVPKWFDDFVKENTIPQAGYKNNPANQGGAAPKLTDPTTPGKSIEFPEPWSDWIEEYATNGRIISGGE